MNAKKCDRCGAYYHESEMNPFKRMSESLRMLTEVATSIETPDIQSRMEEKIDLCKECSDSLRGWLKEGRK